MSSLIRGFLLIFAWNGLYRISMGTHEEREVMQEVTASGEVDHHQRKRLSAALNQPADASKVLEVIEAGLAANRACPPCASVECTVTVGSAGCNVPGVNTATKPSMPSWARRWLVFAMSQNG
jgi:hypothetical protein